MVNHVPLPSAPYVNQEAKMVSLWCAVLRPQPDSEPAGDAHHMPWYAVVGGLGGVMLA